MTPRPPPLTGVRLLRLIVRLMPPGFRQRHGQDVLECYRDAWDAEAESWGWGKRAGFVVGAWVSTTRTLAGAWWMAMTGRGARDGTGMMGGATVRSEVRQTLRRLTRKPGFAVMVVLTLGMGIGVNTAVFTVLHSVLLAPLPYEDGEQLVRLYLNRVDRPGEFDYLNLSTPAIHELRDETPSLGSVAVLENHTPEGVDLGDTDRPERLRMLRVSAEYFETFGYTPLVGRVFERADEVTESRVAIVSEDVWSRHMGGRAESLGSSLTLDGEPYRIVGVMIDDFEDPLEGAVDVWMPLELYGEGEAYWGNNWLTAIGRLAPGATPTSLRAELDVLEGRHALLGPDAAEKGFTDVPLREDLVGSSRPMLLAVMGAVVVLLLLTAVNVTSLMLAGAAARERELAIRTSIGASRGVLALQFTVESVLLALAGGAAGLVLAVVTLDLILLVAPADLPMAGRIRLGGAGIAFAGGGSALLGLVLGLATAAPFIGPRLEGLATGTRGDGTAQGRPGLRATLVRVEVALAVMLLAGAGVLGRSLYNLQHRDLGVDPASVLTFHVGLPDVRYGSDPLIHDFSERFHAQVRAIPGVETVGVTSRLPALGSFNTFGTRRADGPDRPWDVDNISVNQRWVAGEYFETIELEIVRGRAFDATDEADVPYRTVVSQALADQLFGDEDPLGQWLYIAGRYTEIVGVAETEASTPRGPGALVAYHHQRQWISGSREMTHVVRAAVPVAGLIPALRDALARVDGELVLNEPTPLTEVIGRGIAVERFAATLLLCFAVLAVAVAGLGLYGVLAHLVGQRRREIGIRRALGANGGGVVALVVRRGLALAVTGAVAGVGAAWLLGSFLEFLVFGVSPRDPLAMMAAPAVLLVVAALASTLPAVRATRVSPLTALESR